MSNKINANYIYIKMYVIFHILSELIKMFIVLEKFSFLVFVSDF